MEITAKNMATIKRIAQSCGPTVTKKQRKQEALLKIANEIKALDEEMAGLQAAIAPLTGGRTTEQLLIRVVENNASKWVPNPDVLRWNETKRVWEDVTDAPGETTTEEAPVEQDPVTEEPEGDPVPSEEEVEAAQEAAQAEAEAAGDPFQE